MNKEELKRLKRKLETKVCIEDAYSGSQQLTQYEIEQRINTLGAIDNIEKYFESIITYFSAKGIKYDEITLVPFFSLIVKEKDLNESTVIKNNAKPLPRLVVVRINAFYCMDNHQKIMEDPDTFFKDNFNEYVVVFDDFIKLLKERGFEYSGLCSIDDIQKVIVSGSPAISNITLSFKSKLTKKKA